MACGKYKSIHEVAKKYRVAVEAKPFIELLPLLPDERFQQELSWVIENIDVHMSEAAVSEFMIAPILKEVWRNYRASLLIWSHVALNVGDEFEGYPDYLFTKLTELGMIRDKPYLMVCEAKKDDFDGAWGQCFAALIAAQVINDNDHLILHGIVSNGDGWQFGKLQGKSFVRDPRLFTITDLSELFAALNYIFEQAKQQAALA